MQSLCLDVEVLSTTGEEIEMRELDEDVYRTAEELASTSARPEPRVRRGGRREGLRRGVSEMLDVNDFDQLRIGWRRRTTSARGRTAGPQARDDQLPHAASGEGRALLREDLRSHKDWECYCGKYKRVRFRGIICERCGVGGHPLEGAPRADGPHRARRPVVHIWYLRGTRPGSPTCSWDRGPGGAEGQAAREGHLLRRLPRHQGRRGEAAQRPPEPRGRAVERDR